MAAKVGQTEATNVQWSRVQHVEGGPFCVAIHDLALSGICKAENTSLISSLEIFEDCNSSVYLPITTTGRICKILVCILDNLRSLKISRAKHDGELRGQ